ncbi:MAG: hypothetical protein IT211_08495 [Armatimonadetes bacterium]|nr:hypothetical protein [Armatimonadota bacterium]
MNRTTIIALVLIIASVVGCVGYSHLPKPKDIITHTKGAEVELFDANEDQLFDGELLAIQNDTLYILSLIADSNYISHIGQQLLVPNTWIGAIPKSFVGSMHLRVARTANSPTSAGIWFTGLLASTLSHGFYIVATLPTTLAWGLPTVIDATTTAFHVEVPEAELHKFARFPQGLPPGVNLSMID